MQTSMLYTIGTALTRAHEEGSFVDVLVEGSWLTGRIVGSDGMGVVLEDADEHCVVRLDRIAAVRVRHTGTATAEPPADDARPMPAPGQPLLVTEVA